MGTHTAVCSLATLVETLPGLSPSLSVLGRGNFGSHKNISKIFCPGVAYHGWFGHVVKDPWVPGHQAIPAVLEDSRDIGKSLVKRNHKDRSLICWFLNFGKGCQGCS